MSALIWWARTLCRWWRGPVAPPCSCAAPGPAVIVNMNGAGLWCETCRGSL